MTKKIPKLPLRLPKENALKSTFVNATGVLRAAKASPDEALGELFEAVQQNNMYGDGMTFIDLVPNVRMKQIKKRYELVKDDPDFDLQEFVTRYFSPYSLGDDENYQTNTNHTPREHIRELWHVLERRNRLDRGSLIALPYPYIVPGGRFTAQFYWDSYFTMLGLAADGRWDMVENMLKNCTYMIRKFGFIPNGNRTYYLSRSQPPFFSHMVKLQAGHRNRKRTLIEHLPYLLAEHRFWTKGKRTLAKLDEAAALRRLVRMPDGTLLGRYFDNKKTPRPESLREDLKTAKTQSNTEKVYVDLRAAAESGWDFSSRWMRDSQDIGTIHTTDIVPVDLNCLLYHLEATIAETYQLLYQPLLARKFHRLAERRKAAIHKYMWNEKEQFFGDYDFRMGAQTSRLTLAAVYPLFTKIATPAQAQAVAKRLEKDFLHTGGVVTTLVQTEQQWDWPNGWAPLQWVTIQGLRAYGFHALADKIKVRWIESCTYTYDKKAKLVEKYNVVAPRKASGGGEYELQDGFGWTNGVLAALLAEDETTQSRT